MIKSDERVAPADGKPRREQLVAQCLASLGKNWAASSFHEMSLAGRNIEGGWPGTLAEARALVLRGLSQELAAQGLGAPSASELADGPTVVNSHARTEWLRVSKVQRLSHGQR